jgi:integrase
MVGPIVRSRINKRILMPAYRDKRDGSWRYRKWVTLPDGTRDRIAGTPTIDTKAAAESAERAHIERVMNPERARILVETAAPKRKEKTIREHAEVFLASYKPGSKPSEKRTKKWILESRLLPYFGEMVISDLDQPTVDGFVAAELVGRSVKSVNNRLAVLSSLIRYVTGERSKLRFKIEGMAGELNAVPWGDVERLLAVANARARMSVLLAAEAGLRAGEIRGLQWGDLKEGQIFIRRALDNETNQAIPPKHNKARTVPLSPRVAAALAELPKRGLWVVSDDDGDPIDYDRAGGLLETVSALYKLAEVPKPPKAIHCLRHTFGTVMARRVPLGVLQELMGHSDIATTMRYVDVSEDDKRDAIAAVFGAIGGQPAGNEASSFGAFGQQVGNEAAEA